MGTRLWVEGWQRKRRHKRKPPHKGPVGFVKSGSTKEVKRKGAKAKLGSGSPGPIGSPLHPARHENPEGGSGETGAQKTAVYKTTKKGTNWRQPGVEKIRTRKARQEGGTEFPGGLEETRLEKGTQMSKCDLFGG